MARHLLVGCHVNSTHQGPRELAPNIYTVAVSHGKGLITAPLRMTLVRLSDGQLWMHSPVAIDDALAAQIAKLGQVAHIVAPNRFHSLFAAQARARYSNAMLWAAPGLQAKVPTLPVDRVLHQSPPPWAGELDQVLIDGLPTLAETVFYHRSSRSLVCTDFLFNVREDPSWTMRMIWRLFGVWNKVAQNRMWWFLRKDKQAAARSLERVWGWDIERVVMCHGEVLETDAQQQMHAATQWLTQV